MLKNLAKDFMKEVRSRVAAGPPPHPVTAELCNRLTTTHMTYFSLRVLQHLRGVHLHFYEAFILVQPEAFLSALKKEHFEATEGFKMSIV